jgi:hypothetical protein
MEDINLQINVVWAAMLNGQWESNLANLRLVCRTRFDAGLLCDFRSVRGLNLSLIFLPGPPPLNLQPFPDPSKTFRAGLRSVVMP